MTYGVVSFQMNILKRIPSHFIKKCVKTPLNIFKQYSIRDGGVKRPYMAKRPAWQNDISNGLYVNIRDKDRSLLLAFVPKCPIFHKYPY